MLNCGESPEVIRSGCKASESSPSPFDACRRETPSEVETSGQNLLACSEKNEATASVTFTENQEAKLLLVHDIDMLQNKRQKVSEPEEGGSVGLKATESSILDWLENSGDGVSVCYLDPNLCSDM